MERATVPALIVAAGLALGGWAAGHGFARGRAADHFVTVKGIAEREVSADLAIWPLRVVASGDDLSRANTQLQSSVREIFRFLSRHGIDTTQARVQDFVVTDTYAAEYRSPQGGNRYIIRQTVVVRSDNPASVAQASQLVGELVAAGVVLTSGAEYGTGGPTFIFRGLNDIKPQMISDATQRAREAAAQFAANSHTTLGGIRNANQGVFEILPRDQAPGITEASQIMKTVRVVSTIEYLLR
jgi:hypothetical protein